MDGCRDRVPTVGSNVFHINTLRFVLCMLMLLAGRGTSTVDGLAIAWSVLEHLHNNIRKTPTHGNRNSTSNVLRIVCLECRTLSATHYGELGQLGVRLPHAGCYQVTANRSSLGIQFAYRIVVCMEFN